MNETNCFENSYRPKLRASLEGFEPTTRCLEDRLTKTTSKNLGAFPLFINISILIHRHVL